MPVSCGCYSKICYITFLTLHDAPSQNEHLMPPGPCWPDALNTKFYAFSEAKMCLSTYLGMKPMTYDQLRPLKSLKIVIRHLKYTDKNT